MRRLLPTSLTLSALLGWALIAPAADPPKPIKLLIITGDHGHAWKGFPKAASK
jgi:hypothetical protein